ncbi:MAG TPA: MauE/DoxX family redox-associated membrane protein [Candidatus Limnocylindrales bacterium]
MAALILLCQAVLIGTFGLSVVSKVYDRGIYLSFRRSLPATLRIPARLAPAVAVSVVTAEVITALLLVAGIAQGPLAPGGFLVAAALMAAFTAAIGLMLKRRVTEPCHCFGASARPPSPTDLWRCIALLAIALTGAALSRSAEDGGVVGGSFPAALAIGLGIFNAVVLVVILRLLRKQTRLLLLSIGSAADRQAMVMVENGGRVGRFDTETVDGERVTRESLRGTTLVGFLSPTCAACADSLPGFILRARRRGRDQTLAVVVGEPDTAREMRDSLRDVARVVVEPEMGAVARAFKVDGFPAFAILSGNTVAGSDFDLHRLPEPA